MSNKRFISADSQINRDILGTNLFAYCSNNPVNRIDDQGTFWDFFLDVASTAYSAWQVIKNPKDPANWMALGADVACLAIPGATGGGIIVRGAKYADEAVSAGKNLNRIENTTNIASDTYTTLYRSVSKAEADDIVCKGEFSLSPMGMESKQFGYNLDETRAFGKKFNQNIIVSAQIPTSMISSFDTTSVDTVIFRSRTLTLDIEHMGRFNDAVRGTIKIMQ